MGFEPTTSDHKKLSSISNKLRALWRLKEREKARRVNNIARRHTKFVTVRLNASGCITSGKSKNKHNRSSIKDYGNLRNVVLENNSNLLNHNYKQNLLQNVNQQQQK